MRAAAQGEKRRTPLRRDATHVNVQRRGAGGRNRSAEGIKDTGIKCGVSDACTKSPACVACHLSSFSSLMVEQRKGHQTVHIHTCVQPCQREREIPHYERDKEHEKESSRARAREYVCAYVFVDVCMFVHVHFDI